MRAHEASLVYRWQSIGEVGEVWKCSQRKADSKPIPVSCPWKRLLPVSLRVSSTPSTLSPIHTATRWFTGSGAGVALISSPLNMQPDVPSLRISLYDLDRNVAFALVWNQLNFRATLADIYFICKMDILECRYFRLLHDIFILLNNSRDELYFNFIKLYIFPNFRFFWRDFFYFSFH